MSKYSNNRTIILFMTFCISGLIFCLPVSLKAGPALLCHPLNIGNAKSLPSGNGPFGYDRNYNRNNLLKDALALLNTDMPIIVRMETLRRATLYITRNLSGSHGSGAYSDADRAIAFELLSRLKTRIGEDHNKSTNMLAYFDAGYLMQCYREAGLIKNNIGYDWVRKAIRINGASPEMEFACALITKRNILKTRQNQHLRSAKAGLEDGSLLAINLDLHFRD